jgi:hypothetical protein
VKRAHTLGVVLLLALVLPSLAAARSRTISLSVEGRQHEVLVDGALTGPASHARVLLQQLAEAHGRWLWRTRTAARLHGRHFRLRWQHAPHGAPLLVRAIVLAHHILIARSATSQVTAGDPGTVFYSGLGQAGAKDVSSRSAVRLVQSDKPPLIADPFDGRWTTDTQCDISAAVPRQLPPTGEPITALAGYSLGRLGPIYFLENREAWPSQVSYILLLDPGNESEMAPSCDNWTNIDPTKALASWLSLHSSNRLVVMAGPVTQKDHLAGLKKHYLKDLSPAEERQVMICEYATPGHTHFLVNSDGGFGWMVGAYPPGSCPGGVHEPNWRKAFPTAPPPSSLGPPPAAAPGGGTAPLGPGEFRVTNAAGGVYWRSAPDWGTPVATSGNGFYEGTVVRVSCYAAGAGNVPGSSDAMWEQASWAAGPGSGSGWINEHFVDDGAALGEPSPGIGPCSSSPPPPEQPSTWAEQETPNHPVNTFTDYHNASGVGPAIAAGQWVQVSCKIYDPTIGSVNPDGYWYRIASSPWNNAYYSPANTFMNGDPYGGPYTHNTDFGVTNC